MKTIKLNNCIPPHIGIAISMVLALLAGCSEPSEAAEDKVKEKNTVEQVTNQSKKVINNQWLIGMVEGAYLLNPNLNNFAIDVDANGSTVHISGSVDKESERQLAEQIALSVDGVDKVENRIQVVVESEPSSPSEEPGIKRTISDAAITARVKARLLANSEISGFAINVDTHNTEVTLSGEVSSSTEKDLAYYITKNTLGVTDVENKIMVVSSDKLTSTH